MPADTKKFSRPVRVLNRESLKSAWLKSRDSKSRPGAAGVDGVTARQFKRDVEGNLSRLADDIRAGRYRFSDLRPFFIPKATGHRIICVPTVSDRLVQRTISEHLSKVNRFRLLNDVSFGFVRGRGGVGGAVEAAIQLRASREWVLKTDVQSFFDRIDRAQLKELLKRRLRNNSLLPVLCDVVDCEARSRTAEVDEGYRQLVFMVAKG